MQNDGVLCLLGAAKRRSFMQSHALLVSTGVLLLVSCHSSLAADAGTITNAPTGIYESLMDMPKFTVQLITNGDYQVRTTALGANSQQGRWKWNDKRQEFLLTPATNGAPFRYEFRRLRVDPREPDTLQWIPSQRVSGEAGAIDYIRFKRKSR
jgi:hypothetical protein